LRPAADAVVVDTTNLDLTAVIDRLAALVAPHLQG
jgi:cytidylate kinase